VKKGASKYAIDLIKSAIANAKRKQGVDVANLYISRLIADCGPTLKRYRAASMGRASPILKRTSHLTVELDETRPQDRKAAKPHIKGKEAVKEKEEGKVKSQKSKLKTTAQSLKLKTKHPGPKDT
jgi:large subunit ribosomal protein L22